MKPRGALDDLATRLLLDLLGGGPRTLDVLAERFGRSRRTVYDRLLDLRSAGLVSWEDHMQGTLHPTCAVIVVFTP